MNLAVRGPWLIQTIRAEGRKPQNVGWVKVFIKEVGRIYCDSTNGIGAVRE